MRSTIGLNERASTLFSECRGYGFGGESTVNGEDKNDRKENLAWALSLGYSITRHLRVKVAYLGTRAQESVGLDSDSIAVGFSIFW